MESVCPGRITEIARGASRKFWLALSLVAPHGREGLASENSRRAKYDRLTSY